jgi:peptidoglycan/xylan/chitin deacetylase (PgdA/CDA1 family)
VTDSRTFHWPNGAHLAVVFHVAWEAWPDHLGTRSSRQNNSRRPVPETAKYAHDSSSLNEHAFAETGGLQRLIQLYSRWEIPVSCVISGSTIETYPDLALKLADENWDLGIQPWEHEYLVMYDPDEERTSIERADKAFRKLFNAPPSGFVAPGAMYTPATYDIIADLDIKWILAGRNCESPYVVKRPGKRPLVFQPLELTDYESYGHRQSPRTVLGMVKDAFDALYEEGSSGGMGKMLSYATHPFLSHPYRTRPLEDFIAYIKRVPNVWITTRAEITDYLLNEYPELTLDALYPESAVASEQRYGLNLALRPAAGSATRQERIA